MGRAQQNIQLIAPDPPLPRQVSLPRGFASAGRAVFIRVGSACYAASVFIDGRLVGSHEGGHLPFQFDITDLLSELGGAAGGGAMPLSFTVAIRVEALLSPQRVPPGALAQRPIQYPSVNFDFFPYGGEASRSRVEASSLPGSEADHTSRGGSSAESLALSLPSSAAGIHRAVTLVSLPKTHIKDITACRCRPDLLGSAGFSTCCFLPHAAQRV